MGSTELGRGESKGVVMEGRARGSWGWVKDVTASRPFVHLTGSLAQHCPRAA